MHVEESDYISINAAAPSAISTSSITTKNALTNYKFVGPRIACPNDPTYDEDWSVVWENILSTANPLTSGVVGVSKYQNSEYPGGGSNDYWYYTDGSQAPSPGDIPDMETFGRQKWPCVTYDNYAGNGIQISWYCDGLQHLYGLIHKTTIGISADATGAVAYNTCISSSGICYEIASPNYKENQLFPSLAGRHARDCNIAYYDKDSGYITQHDFDLCYTFKNSSLNHGQVKNIKEYSQKTNSKISLTVAPNPSTGNVVVNFKTNDLSCIYNYSLEIYPNPIVQSLKADFFSSSDEKAFVYIKDISGKKIFQNNLTIKKGKNPISIRFDGLSPGAYLLCIQLGQKIYSEQFLNMN